MKAYLVIAVALTLGCATTAATSESQGQALTSNKALARQEIEQFEG